MDFPELFPLTRVNDFIKSAKWRGLAVLCSTNNQDQRDKVLACTGDLFTDRDAALHVITKPMLSASVSPLVAVATLLPAKPGVKYYIHSLAFAVTMAAADTTTVITVLGTQNGLSCYLGQVRVVPSVAQVINTSIVLDMWMDENTAVTAQNTTADPATAARVIVAYQEVGAR